MGSDYSEGEIQIPYFDLKKEFLETKQGSEEWKELSGKVREASEEYGCFMVGYDGFPSELREEIFMGMHDLFHLPVETKEKNSHPQPYRAYGRSSDVDPQLESLCIEEAHCLDSVQAFTDLMWPHGNPAFCGTMNSTARKMHELKLVFLKMILDSYGVPTYFDALAENTTSFLRMNKYKPPLVSDKADIVFPAHTDRGFLAVLCLDQVKGFELLTKQGHWLKLTPLQDCFLVIIGDCFKAWSNGGLHSVVHRVVMHRGDKERHACIMFVEPNDGEVVEVAKELVDDDHPLLFRPINFTDFLNYCVSNRTVNVLQTYAGV